MIDYEKIDYVNDFEYTKFEISDFYSYYLKLRKVYFNEVENNVSAVLRMIIMIPINLYPATIEYLITDDPVELKYIESFLNINSYVGKISNEEIKIYFERIKDKLDQPSIDNEEDTIDKIKLIFENFCFLCIDQPRRAKFSLDNYVKSILSSKKQKYNYIEECALYLYGLVERKLGSKYVEYYISKSESVGKYMERVLVEMDNIRYNLIEYWDGTKFERISRKSYANNNHKLIFWSNILLHVEYHSFVKVILGLQPFYEVKIENY